MCGVQLKVVGKSMDLDELIIIWNKFPRWQKMVYIVCILVIVFLLGYLLGYGSGEDHAKAFLTVQSVGSPLIAI